jgi:aromatic-L-amino-acid/L-tryptophan decarboxylase
MLQMNSDNRIEELRQTLAHPLPHPNSLAAKDHASLVIDFLNQRSNILPGEGIGSTRCREEMETLLRELPPEIGRDFKTVFAEFERKVVPNAIRFDHPSFFGFIPSAPTVLSTLGDMLCAGTNFSVNDWRTAAGPTQVELVVLDWFKAFLGYPPEAQGVLTSGGSEANLTGLMAAQERLCYDNRASAVWYWTDQRHASMDRALFVMGYRPEQGRVIATDDRFRMQPDALREAISHDRSIGRIPWLVVGNGGATNTGAVDPLVQLAELCRQEKLWFHVDAAYGWAASLIPAGKTVLEGIERADSITLDPHKWFAQTFDVGCVLVRDGVLLSQAFAFDKSEDKEEIDLSDRGIASTRSFRALKIWFSVNCLGVGWFRALVRHSCSLAEFAEFLLTHSPVFEVLAPRQLSIVCFRYVPSRFPVNEQDRERELNHLNLAIAQELRASGAACVSTTRLRGRVALRFCFVNWRTTAADIENVLRAIADIAGRRYPV